MICPQLPLFKNKPQKGQSLHIEFAFFSFHEQTVLKKSLQDESDLFHMIYLILGEKENVIQVDKHNVVNEI